jgi:hypothetical protein
MRKGEKNLIFKIILKMNQENKKTRSVFVSDYDKTLLQCNNIKNDTIQNALKRTLAIDYNDAKALLKSEILNIIGLYCANTVDYPDLEDDAIRCLYFEYDHFSSTNEGIGYIYLESAEEEDFMDMEEEFSIPLALMEPLFEARKEIGFDDDTTDDMEIFSNWANTYQCLLFHDAIQELVNIDAFQAVYMANICTILLGEHDYRNEMVYVFGNDADIMADLESEN